MATYTSTNLKSRFFFNNGTWNYLHKAFGERNQNGNGKGGLPGWPNQNEDDYKGQEGHAKGLLLYVTLHPLVHSLNCKTKPFSKYSSKIEPDQISLTINRKEDRGTFVKE